MRKKFSDETPTPQAIRLRFREKIFFYA